LFFAGKLTSISFLGLSGVKFSAAHAVQLGVALAALPSLKYLDLSDNHELTGHGVCAILSSLAGMIPFIFLLICYYYSLCRIEPVSAVAFFEFVRHWRMSF
jgi:hypothetical protein